MRTVNLKSRRRRAHLSLRAVEELYKRSVALGFSLVYMREHRTGRAATLRVADYAYRFMNGEDVHEINRDADLALKIASLDKPPSKKGWFR